MEVKDFLAEVGEEALWWATFFFSCFALLVILDVMCCESLVYMCHVSCACHKGCRRVLAARGPCVVCPAIQAKNGLDSGLVPATWHLAIQLTSDPRRAWREYSHAESNPIRTEGERDLSQHMCKECTL